MVGATGTWSVLFGLGGIAVVVLALILMRQKANQAELWKQDPENPGPIRQENTDDGGRDAADGVGGAGGTDCGTAEDEGNPGGADPDGSDPEGRGR